MHNKVIACIDDSRYAEAVCDYASWSSSRLQAPLSLLHTLEVPASRPQNLSGSIGFGAQEALLQELASLDEQRAKLALEQGKHLLQAARERAEQQGIAEVEVRQRHGDLVDALVDLEAEIRMLVVGKRGADTESAHGHIGSHLEAVIRTMHRPILIAQQSFEPPQKILFAFDGSPTTLKGVQMVADSPLFDGIPLTLVMVGSDTDATREPLLQAQQTVQAAGFAAEAKVIPGEADTALIDYQTEHGFDLMIMGAYGHSRIRHFIVGSTTTAMIRKTRVSLMILR